MATTGDTLPGTGSTVARVANAWVNPSRITADDGSLATQTTSSAATDYLVASNFGFSVPSNATITGVIVKVKYSESTAGNDDFTLQLQDAAGALFGSSQTYTETTSTPSAVTVTLGSSADLWSATITPTIINDADFGVRFWSTSGSGTFSVDAIWVSVWFNVPASGLLMGML